VLEKARARIRVLLGLSVVCLSILFGNPWSGHSQESEIEKPLPRNFTYYTIRNDLRRCAAPFCGGFFVREVNRDQTRCGDGSLLRECYVESLDFSDTLIGGDPGPVVRDSPELLLVRGTFDEIPWREVPVRLDVLRVSEVYQSALKRAPRSTFFRVRATGIVCIRFPCPLFSRVELNSVERPVPFAVLDLTALGRLGDKLPDLLALPAGVIVTGVPIGEPPESGLAPGLGVRDAFLPVGRGRVPKHPAPGACAGGPRLGPIDAPPKICSEVFDPVCGCDGITYSNACFAEVAGVRVAHPGACNDPITYPGPPTE